MFITIASVLLSLNAFATPSQPAAKPSPRANVDTAVVEAIRLLEAKDHKTFLTQFVPPDQLKDLAGTPEAFDALVKTFPPRGERILTALKSVRTQTPTYDAAKTTATFQVQQPGMPSALTFVKVGAFWYIGNK